LRQVREESTAPSSSPKCGAVLSVCTADQGLINSRRVSGLQPAAPERRGRAADVGERRPTSTRQPSIWEVPPWH